MRSRVPPSPHYDARVIAAEPRQRFPVGAALLFLGGIAWLSCSITFVYLGMRSVMDVGGACADGGPYVSAQPCPDNVAWFMIGGIWGGFLAAGAIIVGAARLGRGYGMIVLLAWPALFLSLGWNFLEYGLDPPGPGGVEIGWLVCAALFAVMGGGPLVIALRQPSRVWRLVWPAEEPEGGRGRRRRFGLSGGRPRRQAAAQRPAAAAPRPARAEPEAVDVVDRLERLARLHREGAIDDAEYDAAKRAVLEDAR